MHICLATDIDINALKDVKSNIKDISSHMVEHILCSIKLYNDGFLEVTPGFSGVISESSDSMTAGVGCAPERSSLSLFLDDNTVRTGISKGFKLTTNKIRSNKGIEYEYSIQNINDILIPYQTAEIMKKQKLLDKKSFIQNKSSSDTSTWKQDPPSKNFDKVIGIYAEIVNGENFFGKNLFVNYQVQVPQGWVIRTGNLNDGTAERDVAALVSVEKLREGYSTSEIGEFQSLKGTNKGKEKSEGSMNNRDRERGGERGGKDKENISGVDILALDGYTDGLSAHGMLYGTTHTVIARESRGMTSLIDRSKYKPSYVNFTFQKGTRLFIGFSFYIITVVAIILGQSYPFWLVPALVILFTLGTGYPGGTIQVILRKNESKKSMNNNNTYNNNKNNHNNDDKKNNDKKNINKTNTYTQNESQNRLVGPLISTTVAHFNHLLSLSFDVKDLSQSAQSINPFQKTPIMHFQVYSTSLMGRFVLEGYGYYQIPG